MAASTTTTEAALRLTATDHTDAAMRSAGRNVDNLTRAVERNTSQQAVLFQRAAGGAAGLERRLTAATAAMGVGEVLRKSVVEFANMDRRMTRLSQNADVTKTAIGGMKNELIKLADDAGVSIDSVISGFETFVRQTGDYDSATKQIRNIVIANQGLGAEMEQTAQTARVLQNVLDFKPENTMRAFDMIAYAGNKGAFEAKHIAEYIPLLGEVMSRAGLKGAKGLAEALAMLETIQETVRDPEQTALGFRDMFQRMTTQETTNNFDKVLGAGVFEGVMDKTRRQGKSLSATFVQVTDEALKVMAKKRNVPEESRMQFLANLFPEQDSQRAVGALLARYGKVGPLIEEILNKSTGQAERQARGVMNDTRSDLDRLGNKYEEVKLQLGKSLIDAGALSGMDEFKKNIADIIRVLDEFGGIVKDFREGNFIKGLGRIGSNALGAMHERFNEVTARTRDEATANAKSYRERAHTNRAKGRPVTADRLEAWARDEDARAALMEHRLKHGLGVPQALGNAIKGAKDAAGAASDFGRGAFLPNGLPAPVQPTRPGEIRRAMPPEVQMFRQPLDDAEARLRELQQRLDQQERDAGSRPDPYQPGRVMRQQMGYEGGEGMGGLIHKTALTRETRDATERGQDEQRREIQKTNEILRGLISRVSLANGGDAAGGLGGGAGGGEAGGGSGGVGGAPNMRYGGQGAATGGGEGSSGGDANPGGGSGSGRTPEGTASDNTPRGNGAGTRGAARTGQMMRYAMDQLRREGVPEKHLRRAAAQLVGQAHMESGLDPNKTHDGGTGYGIYGARDPRPGVGRRTNMLNWLKANGYAPNSAEGQMRYMAKEAMSGKYKRTRSILMGEGSGNLEADTNTVTKEFESPAIVNRRSGAVANADRIGPEEGTGEGESKAAETTAGANSNDDVRFKNRAENAAGRNEQGVTDAALDAQRRGLPGGFNRITAMNDRFHQGRRSKHNQGLAFDATIKDTKFSAQAAEVMRQRMRERGLTDEQFRVIDEYRNPSGHSTGGHLHTQFNNREAARKYAESVAKERAAAAASAKAREPAGPNAPGLEAGGTGFRPRGQDVEAMQQHRREMERPIRIRYETDGNSSNIGHRGPVQARREQEGNMRSARYNSFSEVGVA